MTCGFRFRVAVLSMARQNRDICRGEGVRGPENQGFLQFVLLLQLCHSDGRYCRSALIDPSFCSRRVLSGCIWYADIAGCAGRLLGKLCRHIVRSLAAGAVDHSAPITLRVVSAHLVCAGPYSCLELYSRARAVPPLHDADRAPLPPYRNHEREHWTCVRTFVAST